MNGAEYKKNKGVNLNNVLQRAYPKKISALRARQNLNYLKIKNILLQQI